MISTVLASQKKVFQTIGNQNSQIGVPLTLSHLTREDEIAVLEIGMSEIEKNEYNLNCYNDWCKSYRTVKDAGEYLS